VRVASGHIIINNKCKPPALLFAFRSIRTCRELRTWRRFWFWDPRGNILGPQTTSEQNMCKSGALIRGAKARSQPWLPPRARGFARAACQMAPHSWPSGPVPGW
jgi:hypothetical protein